MEIEEQLLSEYRSFSLDRILSSRAKREILAFTYRRNDNCDSPDPALSSEVGYTALSLTSALLLEELVEKPFLRKLIDNRIVLKSIERYAFLTHEFKNGLHGFGFSARNPV